MSITNSYVLKNYTIKYVEIRYFIKLSRKLQNTIKYTLYALSLHEIKIVKWFVLTNGKRVLAINNMWTFATAALEP